MLTVCLALLTALPQGAPKFSGYPGQDALSYDIELDVDLEHGRLTGKVHYVFAAEKPLDHIRLDSTPSEDDGWTIRFKDASGAPMTAERPELEDGVLLVRLPEGEVAVGTEVSFTAELEGVPPDGFFFRPNRYGEPMAFTDHYSIRTRGWLPCEDHPSDRARFRVTVSYAPGNVAVASGKSLPVEPAPDRPDRVFWRSETQSDIPPYMLAIVVGQFARVAEAGDDRLVPHYVYKRDADKAKPFLTQHARWIQLMEETFGPYAFAKYGVVQCPTRWGGFEAPGNVLVSERLFDMGDRAHSILAHELTHMWFGDAVGYADWHEVWLSEGFASYLGPWLRSRTGGPPLRDAMLAMRERWTRSFESRRKPIRWAQFAHPDRALNANTYPKGAWVLHMLRSELGDDLFFAGLRDYYEQHTGKATTSTALVTSLWRSTGRKLSWFFEQWLNRPDCPELRVALYPKLIVVAQIQPGRVFRFRLPLQWQDSSEKTVHKVVEITKRLTRVKLDEEVSNLVVDPDIELLYRTAGEVR